MKRDWLSSAGCCECVQSTRTRVLDIDQSHPVQQKYPGEEAPHEAPRIPGAEAWRLPRQEDAVAKHQSNASAEWDHKAAGGSASRATEELAAVSLEKALDTLADSNPLLQAGSSVEGSGETSVPVGALEEQQQQQQQQQQQGKAAGSCDRALDPTSPDPSENRKKVVHIVSAENTVQEPNVSQGTPSLDDSPIGPLKDLPRHLSGPDCVASQPSSSAMPTDFDVISSPAKSACESNKKLIHSRSDWGTASFHSMRSANLKRKRQRRWCLDPESRCMRCAASTVRPLANSTFFKMLLICCLLVALFGGSIATLAGLPDDPGLLVMDIIMTTVTVLFILEISFNIILHRDEYPFSAFFWMDLLGTVSMAFEMSYIASGVIRDMDAALLRAARAAKLGARGARFAKMVKLMSVLTVGKETVNKERNKKRKLSLEAANISNNVMLTLSTKVSILTIALVLILPLFEPTIYIEDDFAMETWLLRLEDSYASAYAGLSAGTDSITYSFESTVAEMIEFYSNRYMSPYEVRGYPDILSIDGREVRIPGEALLLEAEQPSRIDYRLRRFVRHCSIERPGCEGGHRAGLYVDFGKARKLEAILNICTIVFVMAVMVFMSFDLSKTLDVMLDIEKMAKMTKIFLKKNPVEDEDLKDMTNEDKGVIAMMKGTGNVEFGIHVGLKSFVMESTNSEHLPVVDELPARVHIIESWELNMLKFDMEKQTLIILYAFFDSELGRTSVRTCTDLETFMRFHRQVKVGYMDLPYHNYAHACDVSHTVYRLLGETQAKEWTTNVEMHALMVSALCHDLGHTGRTNPFIVEMRGELALRYNDKSPLENYHCAKMFEICSKPENNVFGKLDKDSFKQARKVCIAAILHTDNAHHFDMVKEVDFIHESAIEICKNQAQSRDILPEYLEQVLQAHQLSFLQLFLHFADVSNPLKPFEVCRDWAWRVLDEFFAQGDAEKALGVPVGMLNDRDKVNRPGSQHGFINFLVSPLVLGAVKIFHPLLPLASTMVDNLWQWHDIWVHDSAPPEEDMLKRETDIQKVGDVVKALRERGFEPTSKRLSMSASGGRRSSAFSMKMSRLV